MDVKDTTGIQLARHFYKKNLYSKKQQEKLFERFKQMGMSSS